MKIFLAETTSGIASELIELFKFQKRLGKNSLRLYPHLSHNTLTLGDSRFSTIVCPLSVLEKVILILQQRGYYLAQRKLWWEGTVFEIREIAGDT